MRDSMNRLHVGLVIIASVNAEGKEGEMSKSCYHLVRPQAPHWADQLKITHGRLYHLTTLNLCVNFHSFCVDAFDPATTHWNLVV